MRALPVLIALLSGALPARGQSPQQDSARVHALIAIAGEVLYDRPDSAYALCTEAHALAKRAGYAKDIAEVEGWLAYLSEQRGDNATAIEYYQRALATLRSINDRKDEATVLNNLGAIYTNQGRLDDAIETHRRGLALRYELEDSSGIATSLNNIGFLLFRQGRIPEAMERYTEALQLYERLGDHEGIGTALHNIAGIHREQGDHTQALENLERALLIARSQKDLNSMATTEDNIGGVLEEVGRADDALVHYQRALALHDSVGDPRGMGRSWRNIAGIWLEHDAPEKALEAAQRGLALSEVSDDQNGRAGALWMCGRALELLGHRDEARERFLKALEIGRAAGDPRTLRDVSASLSAHYRAEGEWKAALEMSDLHAAMRDSVHNEETRRSTIRQQYQYDFEKKEAVLKAEQEKKDALSAEELQRKEVQRNALLGFAAFGIVFALVDLRRRRRIKQEHARSEALLLNILPEEVADELKAKGEAGAKHFERATILFTDFKGFTSVSEQLTPAELVEELNVCFKAFDGIVTARGIEKIKTIGDAYMAAGGLPDPQHGAPAEVVNAALEMQDFMQRHKAERDAQQKPAFEMRVGIHTGPVVAGIVGVKKFQYDIWGDAVNTASRMESSGEVGKVNISEATYELVKDVKRNGSEEAAFTFTPRGKVQAKGKGELEMYFVRRSSEGA